MVEGFGIIGGIATTYEGNKMIKNNDEDLKKPVKNLHLLLLLASFLVCIALGTYKIHYLIPIIPFFVYVFVEFYSTPFLKAI